MMNYIFYKLYKWAKGNNDDPHFTAILSLSGINFAYAMAALSIVEYILKNKIYSTFLLLDRWVLAIILILFASLHHLVFSLRKGEQLLKKHKIDTKSKERIGTILVWVYILAAAPLAVFITSLLRPK